MAVSVWCESVVTTEAGNVSGVQGATSPSLLTPSSLHRGIGSSKASVLFHY
jgi:hypothetical protein